MPIFAFSAGSLGDILATIGLTAQVVQVVYDNRNIAKDCETLAMELRSLQHVLILADVALQRYESTPLGETLVDFIRPEVAQCHLLLRQFSDKVESCQQALTSTSISNLWRRVVWAASDEAVSLSSKLSGHRLKMALLLVSLNSVGFLVPGRGRIPGDQLFKQSDTFSMTQIKDNTIDIIDPLGDTIPVSTLFCSSWEGFHYVIKGYFVDRIGQAYVERGDYLLVRSDDEQTIASTAFSKTVREGDVFEMSIVLKSQNIDTKECPRCSHFNTCPQSEVDWVQCSACSCRFHTTVSTSHDFSLDDDEGVGVTETNSNPLSHARIGRLGKKQDDISDAKNFRRITLVVRRLNASQFDENATRKKTLSKNSEHFTPQQKHESQNQYITFNGAKNFTFGQIAQLTVEGDAFYNGTPISPQAPMFLGPRNAPRRITLFKNPETFTVGSGEFVSVYGNAYGLRTLRRDDGVGTRLRKVDNASSDRGFEGREVQGGQTQDGRMRNGNTSAYTPLTTPTPVDRDQMDYDQDSDVE